MNIKKGDVLKHKGWSGSRKVLAIVDDCYLMSYTLNQKVGDTFYTLEGLKETFELPEEKWELQDGEFYFFIDNFSEVKESLCVTPFDDVVKSGNYFKTKEEAEVKLAEVLAVLKK